MSVETKHPEYVYFETNLIWRKLRDACDGETKVKLAKGDYLPCPIGYGTNLKINAKYEATLQRAYWADFTGTTHQAYLGEIFRKQPALSFAPTPDMETLLDNVDGWGNSLDAFSKTSVSELIKTGRGGIFATHDTTDGRRLTRDELKRLGKRPRMIYYPESAIVNWNDTPGVDDGYETAEGVLQDNIRLKESYKEWVDEYTCKECEQIRSLELISGVYYEKVFRKDNDSKWVQYGETVRPEIEAGKPLNFIPFWFVGAENNGRKPNQSILQGVTTANFQHYTLFSDLREALHFLVPQMFYRGSMQGSDGKPQEIKADSSYFIGFPQSVQEVGILEYKGAGLMYNIQTLSSLEEQMAKMGTRALEVKKRSAESAEKTRLDKASESSALATIAMNWSEALSAALEVFLRWGGFLNVKDVSYSLNTDYDVSLIESSLLKEMLAGVIQRQISGKVFREFMKASEMYPEDWTPDDEAIQIEAEAAGLEAESEMESKIREIVERMLSSRARTADNEETEDDEETT